jgi:maltokinase
LPGSFPRLGAAHRAALSRLAQALEVAADADREWLAAHAGPLRDRLAPLDGWTPAATQPVHGDLHVGQLLRSAAEPDGDLAVVDFDTAELHGPTVRDLAQLLASLDHVGRIVLRRNASVPVPVPTAAVYRWVEEATRACLDGYLSVPEVGARLDDDVLDAYLVDQCLRDLLYSVHTLPRWAYAPMGTLRRLLGAETAETAETAERG